MTQWTPNSLKFRLLASLRQDDERDFEGILDEVYSSGFNTRLLRGLFCDIFDASEEIVLSRLKLIHKHGKLPRQSDKGDRSVCDDWNPRDMYSEPVLLYRAAFAGFPSVVKFLIEQGYNARRTFRAPHLLQIAALTCEHDDVERKKRTIDALLSGGARIDERAPRERPLVENVAERNLDDILLHLLSIEEQAKKETHKPSQEESNDLFAAVELGCNPKSLRYSVSLDYSIGNPAIMIYRFIINRISIEEITKTIVFFSERAEIRFTAGDIITFIEYYFSYEPFVRPWRRKCLSLLCRFGEDVFASGDLITARNLFCKDCYFEEEQYLWWLLVIGVDPASCARQFKSKPPKSEVSKRRASERNALKSGGFKEKQLRTCYAAGMSFEETPWHAFKEASRESLLELYDSEGTEALRLEMRRQQSEWFWETKISSLCLDVSLGLAALDLPVLVVLNIVDFVGGAAADRVLMFTKWNMLVNVKRAWGTRSRRQ